MDRMTSNALDKKTSGWGLRSFGRKGERQFMSSAIRLLYEYTCTRAYENACIRAIEHTRMHAYQKPVTCSKQKLEACRHTYDCSQVPLT